MQTTKVSWGLVERIAKEAFRLLSKEKHIPNIVCCNRPKDFIAGGLLLPSSITSSLGSVQVLDRLVTTRCKMVILSIDNDPRLTDLVSALHDRLATLPFFYTVKTVVMFNHGFPTYDLSVFDIPYQPIYPWEIQTGGAESSLDTTHLPNSHPSALPSNEIKPQGGK